MLRLFRRTEKTTPGIRWAYALDAAQAAQYRAEKRAEKAQADAARSTELLDDLVRAIGTAPMSTHLDAAQDRTLRGLAVPAPHVTWAPLNRALADARAHLGRTL